MTFTSKDFATVVIPATTQFELPRSLARKVLDVGEKLLVHDPATGTFVAGPKAKDIAVAVHDGDAAAAALWLTELVKEYNDYVKGAVGGGGGTVFFIP